MRNRISEIWTPYDVGIGVEGTAINIGIDDSGGNLLVTVELQPSGDRYTLGFDRRGVVTYTVNIIDRVNHVQLPCANNFGGIYMVENSDFAEMESEWAGQYTEDDAYHLVIPGVDVSIEILTIELPTATKIP